MQNSVPTTQIQIALAKVKVGPVSHLAIPPLAVVSKDGPERVGPYPDYLMLVCGQNEGLGSHILLDKQSHLGQAFFADLFHHQGKVANIYTFTDFREKSFILLSPKFTYVL